jgi:hypothetical protein
VQFACHWAEQFAQSPLDSSVDILVTGLDLEDPGIELGFDPPQALGQLIVFILCDEVYLKQGGGIGDAPAYVGRVHFSVEWDRVTEPPH